MTALLFLQGQMTHKALRPITLNVCWVSSGPPIYGVFVPLSNDCVNVSDAYGANQPAGDRDVFDTDNYPYYVFKDLCTHCVEPEDSKIYGSPVREYWSGAEAKMFDAMEEVLIKASEMNDKNTRATYITSYCNDKQTQAFKDAKELLNDVVLYKNENSNTFKIKKDPETNELTGEKVTVAPLKVTLDSSAYRSVP